MSGQTDQATDRGSLLPPLLALSSCTNPTATTTANHHAFHHSVPSHQEGMVLPAMRRASCLLVALITIIFSLTSGEEAQQGQQGQQQPAALISVFKVS